MKDDNKELLVKDLVLIEQEKIDALALFSSGEQGLMLFLEEIKRRATDFVPDVTTAKGRSEITSRGYKVSQSKVILDDMGKASMEKEMVTVNGINSGRKFTREWLDALRVDILAPLETWKAEEKIRLDAEQKRKEMEEAEETAWAMHDMYLRELDMKLREAALVKAEADRQAVFEKEEAERHEREEAERQKGLEERLEKDRQAAEARRIQEAKEEASRAAEEAARAADEARIRAEIAHAEALKRAEEEKQQAIIDAENKAKAEADRKEQARLDAEEAKKQEDLKRIQDEEHRRTVNQEAMRDLVTKCKLGDVQARSIISAIVRGEIAHTTINY